MDVNYEALLKELEAQEEQLQFDAFSNEIAWEIGQLLVRRAYEQNLAITIDITRNRQQLFHYAFEGTSIDNDEWIKGKYNTVERFGHSSYYVGRTLAAKGKTMEQSKLVPQSQFRAHGGAFPIIIRGTGVIGAITVSGLAQADDHALAIWAITEFLESRKQG